MNILFVDAGNYSRSPAAEMIAKTQFAMNPRLSAVAVSSAGLKDKHVGGPADPRTVEECARRGYDLSAFRCRRIAPRDFEMCDLILAMDRSNLEALQALAPAAALARIELFIPDGEVPDPYFGGPEGFAAAIDMIEARIASLARELAGN
jgi:protein-tyrosine phosphatase